MKARSRAPTETPSCHRRKDCNLRPKYVEAFLTALVNWDFAAENFE